MEIITTKINTMSKREVICIELDRFYKECLTIGKKYEVLHELKSEYRIIDDNNNEYYHPKVYFKPVKNKSKKAKKIKELRAFFNTSVDAIEWCSVVLATRAPLPQAVTKMHNLHIIALEEVSKEKPSMKRVKFLISEMQKLTIQTIKD